MTLMASECAARLLEIVAQHGDLPLGYAPEPGMGHQGVKHLEVLTAKTDGHWEDRDSPTLGGKFIAFNG